LRLQKEIDKEKFLWEEEWERTRVMWALIANVNGNKKSPQDLIKLPRDKENKNEITPEKVKDIEQFAKKRFGSTIKKNGK
jgi:hypothetical protein